MIKVYGIYNNSRYGPRLEYYEDIQSQYRAADEFMRDMVKSLNNEGIKCELLNIGELEK